MDRLQRLKDKTGKGSFENFLSRFLLCDIPMAKTIAMNGRQWYNMFCSQQNDFIRGESAMDNSTLRQKALEGLDGLETPQLPSWESLPQLDLYMDQVIMLMERYLALFSDGKDKLITPSMINNYVKLGLIPPPVKKKYSREHLVRLMTICMLKQVMPIPTLSYLTGKGAQQTGLPESFDQLTLEQSQALEHTARGAREDISALDEENLRQGLAQLALKFSAQANANRILAQKIASLLQQETQVPPKAKTDKDKTKQH